MTRRVSWKKGMRLTDEILKSSDRCYLETFYQTFTLASNGRFGLLPSNREFFISLSINKDVVEVEELNCLALTKSGKIIDLNYNTKFTNNINTRIPIPLGDADKYVLCVEIKDIWKDVEETFCEPDYRFVFIEENKTISSDMFPVACIINDYGWRLDELNFVPPCLFISSHPEYGKKVQSFTNLLKTSSLHLYSCLESDCQTAIRVFLPIIDQLKITMDKDVEMMTPMMLFGNIQKYISGFLCACTLDNSLNLEQSDLYRNYVDAPYNYKDVYLRIGHGLNLCADICEKLSKFKDFVSVVEPKVQAPTIADIYLSHKCTNSKVRIPIDNNEPGASIYYTIDGSEPTLTSNTGNSIIMNSGFVGGRDKEENDRYVVVKVKAFLNGVGSQTNAYKVRLQKDLKHWIEI